MPPTLTPTQIANVSAEPAVTLADLLAHVPMFATLTAEDRVALAKSVDKRRFKRGEYLVRQGDTSGALYILMMGSVSVMATSPESSADGREVLLATLERGDYFGEMSLIDDLPRSADVVAISTTDVLVLGQSQLIACLQTHPAVGVRLMKGLVARLRAADDKIESLALLDVYGRVAKALKDESTLMPDGCRVIGHKISKQKMAQEIGASREMVTKVFKQLEHQGWIHLKADGSLLVNIPK